MTTITDTKKAWSEVADHLSALALKLRCHFEQAGTDPRAAAEVKDALDKLGATFESSFSAIGNAVGDPAVREDVGKVIESLVGAMTTTLSDAGEEVSKAARGMRPGDRS